MSVFYIFRRRCPGKRKQVWLTCFLAYQSTECSRWAIVIGLCPSYVCKQLLKKTISSETTWPNSMKLHRKLPWVSLYKNTTRRHNWSTTTECLASCFAFKNISSETTSPNSRKLYRKLPWVSFCKNKTRGHDWFSTTTTTTIWPTSCFALKKTSPETTRPDSLIHCMSPWPTLLDLCF